MIDQGTVFLSLEETVFQGWKRYREGISGSLRPKLIVITQHNLFLIDLLVGWVVLLVFAGSAGIGSSTTASPTLLDLC